MDTEQPLKCSPSLSASAGDERVDIVKKAASHVWTFLKDNISFANTHGAEFISENHWDEYVPVDVQRSLEQLNDDELVSLPLADSYSNSVNKELSDFLIKSASCRLENLDILEPVPEMCRSDSFKGVVAESMSRKKLHEVEIMANVVSAICQELKSDVVVDVGGGKGYLSLELAGHHGLHVLGLDSNQGNTHGAQQRKDNLRTKWSTLVSKTNETKKSPDEDTPSSCDLKLAMDRYVPVTQYVTSEMSLSSILSQHAPALCPSDTTPSPLHAVITGLHTCGSLAVSAMKLFVEDPMAKALCLVGCCYQLMDEEDGEVKEEVNDCHFPLSSYCKSLGVKLGRNARNLASQSVNRIAQSGQLQGKEFYWRALVDILIDQLGIERPDKITGVRGLNKRSHSFHEYAQRLFRKLGFPVDMVTHELTDQLLTKHDKDQTKMAAFFQLKLSLAPAIESLVLMDRLIYLQEQKHVEKAALVGLFDPVTSPRCYAVYAIKEGS